MSVKCKNCGTMLPDSTFFCTECGTKIETSDKSRVCAKCGAKLREGAIFCVECGTKIGSTNIDNKEGVNQSCNTIVTPKYKKKYWGISLFILLAIVFSSILLFNFDEDESYNNSHNENEMIEQENGDEKLRISRYTEREEAENRLYFIQHSQHLRKEYFTLYALYTDYVFGNGDFSLIAKDVCSPELLKQLRDGYEYDCDNNDCYAVWLFRTNNQDGLSDVCELKNIKIDKGNWYKIDYIDMGHEGTTYIELSVDENWDVKMTGLRPDTSYK